MNSSNPLWLSRARSGGWSTRVPMVQGQAQPSPGPQAWFKGVEVDEHGEKLPIAETYTIRFGIHPPSSGSGGSPLDATVNAYAWVRSTVAGNVIDRKVSIGLGTSLTLTAESVTVDVWDATPAAFIPEIGPQTYSVTVQIAPGERASYLTPPTFQGQADVVDGVQQPPTTPATGVITLAATSGAARFPIPQNAGAISCEVVAVDSVDPANQTKVTVTAMTAAVASKMWNPAVNTGFVVLPPNTTFVEVANSSANTVYVTLTWGIEG